MGRHDALVAPDTQHEVVGQALSTLRDSVGDHTLHDGGDHHEGSDDEDDDEGAWERRGLLATRDGL